MSDNSGSEMPLNSIEHNSSNQASAPKKTAMDILSEIQPNIVMKIIRKLKEKEASLIDKNEELKKRQADLVDELEKMRSEAEVVEEELNELKTHCSALDLSLMSFLQKPKSDIHTRLEGLTVIKALEKIASEEYNVLDVFQAAKTLVEAGFFSDEKKAARSIYARLAKSDFQRYGERKGIYKRIQIDPYA